MRSISDIVINGEIKEVLGLDNFKAYNTRIDRVEADENGLLIGVYGPSDSKNHYKLKRDELPDEIRDNPTEYIGVDFPVIAVYQNNSLIGIIKNEEEH